MDEYHAKGIMIRPMFDEPVKLVCKLCLMSQ